MIDISIVLTQAQLDSIAAQQSGGLHPPVPPTPPPIPPGEQVLDIDWNAPAQVSTHGIGPNDIFIVRFTTQGPSALPSTLSGTNPTMTSFLAYLSDTPNDFRQPGPLGWGAIGNGISPTIFFSVGLDDGRGDPILKPATTYYLNVKIQTPGNSGICDGSFNLNPR